MKCLSIQQPWADTILRHGKDVENRSWATRHRGLIVVHAGKQVDRAAFDYIKEVYGIHLSRTLQTGALLGTVEIVECRLGFIDDPRRSRWHEVGQYGLYLRRPQCFRRPIPMRGQLGLFDLPEAVMAMVRAELEGADAQ